jgi:hypothetical protein
LLQSRENLKFYVEEVSLGLGVVDGSDVVAIDLQIRLVVKLTIRQGSWLTLNKRCSCKRTSNCKRALAINTSKSTPLIYARFSCECFVLLLRATLDVCCVSFCRRGPIYAQPKNRTNLKTMCRYKLHQLTRLRIGPGHPVPTYLHPPHAAILHVRS